jgi:L-fuculose-phosphate aldolase
LPRKNPIVDDIIKTGTVLYRKNYMYATNGNISVRSQKKIYITASGLCKGELSPRDILVTSLNGKVTGGTPSIELGMHLGIYRKRSDVNAVILAHPFFTNLIGIQPGALNLSALPNMEVHLKDVVFLKYIRPGSQELANAVTEAVGKADIVVIHRYGTVTVGDGLSSARYRLERLEYLTRFSVYKQMIF